MDHQITKDHQSPLRQDQFSSEFIDKLLIKLARLGIRLRVENQALKVQAPKGSLTAELKQSLAVHKAALINQLTEAAEKAKITKIFSHKIPQISTQEKIPLSLVQQSYWFLYLLENGQGATYNVSGAIRLEGRLDRQAFTQSMREIVRRHSSLRTNFEDIGGEACQVVRDHILTPIFSDISAEALSEVDKQKAIKNFISDCAQQTFDLRKDLLILVHLLRLGPEEHILVVTMHHIVSDGWSQGVMIKELCRLYPGFLSDPEAHASLLPELPLQYADYTLWQRSWYQGRECERQLDYWTQTLAGAPPLLALPLDRPRPPKQSFKGGGFKHVFSRQLALDLQGFCLREGFTLFVVLLAAYKIVLSRYSRETDIVVGTAVANRPHPDLEGMIGFFANTLALRSRLSAELDFRDFLHQLRKTTHAAHEHSAIPFDQVVEALHPERSLALPPIFQIMFRLFNVPRENLSLAGLNVQNLQNNNLTQTAKLDLNLEFIEIDNGLEVSVEYAKDLFDESTLRRQLNNFEVLLRAAITAPETSIFSLPLLSREENELAFSRDKITQKGDVEFYPKQPCLHHIFEQQVRQRANDLAYVAGDVRLSYDELNRKANQLAHHLQGLGVGPENCVGLCVGRGVYMAIGMLAIMKSGGCYVPLDPHYPKQRLAHMLSLTEPSCVLTQQSWQNVLSGVDIPTLCLDADWSRIAVASDKNPQAQKNAEHAAYVLFTSGSTGKPKGIVVSHSALRNMAAAQKTHSLLAADNRVLQFASMSFSISIWGSFMAWLGGGVLVQVNDDESLPGPALFNLLRREKINTVTWPVSLLANFPEQKFPYLKTVISSAEPCPHAVVERWRKGRRFLNLYGNSEVAIGSSMYEALPGNTHHSIGRPLPNTQMLLLDDGLQPVPIGVIGEIYTSGAGLARGYLKQAEETAERFIDNPFANGDNTRARLYRTGDLARYLSNGEIEFVGREDFQVNIRGFRIELAEIESHLRDEASVAEAVVAVKITEQDQATQQAVPNLVAYLVAEKGQQISYDEIRRNLEKKLPLYMLPFFHCVLDVMPMTANRKIDRLALPEVDIDAQRQSRYRAPETQIQVQLCDIWQEVLGLKRVGIEDNFFAIGGHSLLATQIVSRIQQGFSVDLPLRCIFESPTIAEISREINPNANTHTYTHRSIKSVERSGPQLLSCAQQRLWMLERLEGYSEAYHMAGSFKIVGPVNVTAMQSALDQMLARHEILRTRFQEINGEARQLIDANASIKLCVEDLSGESATAQVQRIKQLSEEHAHQPFDLGRGPLLREMLITLDSNAHILLVNMHHIIADGWSLAVLMREFSYFYSQSLADNKNPVTLPALSIQYGDFSHWQRQWLESSECEAQLDYWKNELAGLAPLELPTDFSRPAVQTHAGAAEKIVISKTMHQGLMALCRGKSLTLYMVLLSAFQILLAKTSGQNDLAIGSPIANRTQREVEDLIGFFVNMLVLRSGFDGDKSLADFLTQVKETTLNAYANQGLPFERLVEAINPVRSLSHSPLFQHVFILQNSPTENTDLGNISVTAIASEITLAKYDLSLCFTEASAASPVGLEGCLEYNTDLFKASTIRRMLGHYRIILEKMITCPEQRISQISLLNDAEWRQIESWNATRKAYPSVCVQTEFESQVRANPNAIALAFADSGTDVTGKINRQLSYAQLNSCSNCLAHYLIAQGIREGDVVGIYMERSSDLIVSILATLKVGAIYLPLSKSYPLARINLLLELSSAKKILCQADADANLLPGHLQCIDLIKEKEKIAGCSEQNLAIERSIDKAAYIMFTSGSTGDPKGIVIPHRAILRLVKNTNYLDLGPSETLLMLASPAFDASTFEIYAALLNGGKLVIAPEDTGFDALAAIIREQNISIMWLTAAMFHAFVQYSPSALSTLRYLLAGGDVLSPKLINLALSQSSTLTIINGYGPTENTTFTCTHTITSSLDENRSVPIGKAIANTQVYILSETLQPQAIGVVGELCVAGDGLALGYLNLEELSQQSFIANPFSNDASSRLYRTGDRARYLEDGSIEFCGRNDHQVKIRGFRIELDEISRQIKNHPQVNDCVVVTKLGAAEEKQLCAYVEVLRMENISKRDLRQYLAEVLPDYMLPTYFVLLDTLPLNANGKVDRAALPDIEIDTQMGYVAAYTELQTLLVELWKDILHLEKIGIQDNFFVIGGDSILSIQLSAQARNRGLIISPRQLFSNQTIETLALSLSSSMQQVKAPFEAPEMVSGKARLTPIQQWFFEEDYIAPHHWNQSLLLRLSSCLEKVALETMLKALLQHHDQLRAQFYQTQTGWEQAVAEGVDQPQVAWENIADLTFPEQALYLEEKIQKLSAGFNLQNGPLLKAAVFDRGDERPPLLWLSFHHLVMDGVSWRIILQDLQQLYLQVVMKKPIVLPAKASSFKDWAKCLYEYSKSDELNREISFWQRQILNPTLLSINSEDNIVAHESHYSVSLSEQDTQYLLRNIPIVWQAKIQEVLLLSLCRGLQACLGGKEFTLEMEGHGREDIFSALDLSRSVGWFTSKFPLCLRLQGSELKEQLIAIQKQVAAVPNNGIGYGLLRYMSGHKALAVTPNIRFNYLGRFDATFPEGSFIAGVEEVLGLARDDRQQRGVQLDINAVVLEGKLSVTFSYVSSCYEKALLETMANTFIGCLHDCIEAMENSSNNNNVRPILQELSSPRYPQKVERNIEKKAPPLFLFHPVEGDCQGYQKLLQRLSADQVVWGISASGLDGNAGILKSIPAMAAHYIDLIKEKSAGPYYLAGHSMGGLIAFEVARQLVSRGDCVERLVIIDVGANESTFLPALDDLTLLNRLAFYYALHEDMAALEKLQRMDLAEGLSYLFQRGKTLGKFSKGFSLNSLQQQAAVLAANFDAARQYQPSEYKGRIFVISAEQQYSTEEINRDLRAEWASVCETPVEGCVVGGSHFSMLQEPHVEAVADCLFIKPEVCDPALEH